MARVVGPEGAGGSQPEPTGDANPGRLLPVATNDNYRGPGPGNSLLHPTDKR